MLIADQRLTKALDTVLGEEVGRRVGARVFRVRHTRDEKQIDVVAAVVTPTEFEAEHVGQIEAVVRERVDPRIRLVLRSVRSTD